MIKTLIFDRPAVPRARHLLTNNEELEMWLSTYCQLRAPHLRDGAPEYIPRCVWDSNDHCGVNHIFVELVGDTTTCIVSVRPKMNQYIKSLYRGKCRLFRMCCKFYKIPYAQARWTHIGMPISTIERTINEWNRLKQFDN